MKDLLLVIAGVLLTSCAAALADPVTYAGKLGKSDIVVELTSDPAQADEKLAGRYFYRSKGADIPLQPMSHKGTTLDLAEEEACDRGKCPDGKIGPTGAKWHLVVANTGKTLKGTWEGKATLPVELTRVGTRPESETYPDTPFGLYSYSEQLTYDLTIPLTMDASAYDFLRADVPLTKSKTEEWGDATSRYVTDPRVHLAYPRIIALGGGVDPAKANAQLRDKQWRYDISGLTCVALQFGGFFDPDSGRGSEGGDLGGYDEMSVGVTWLSPRLMSWTESGSLYCGGAHPYNFSNSYTMDVEKGEMIGVGDLLAGWVDDGPGEKLVAYIEQHRKKPETDSDKEFEADCGMDELISQNLAARFERRDAGMVLVFSLEHLPHAINVCGGDLLELPVAEAKQFLTPKVLALLPQAPDAK